MAIPVGNKSTLSDDVLLIFVAYRQMYLSEDYNSPQSAYWCLKSLIVISLPEDDPFWALEEVPYPTWEAGHVALPGPEQILCNHPAGDHHFLLSPGQFVGWPMKANQAKYCKFAYSSAFAFSVPTGPLIQQIAPDNTLALSRDGGETWAVKWKCEQARFFDINITTTSGSEVVKGVSVRWYPWLDRGVAVDTTLIPPSNRWPDWHVRVHRVVVNETLRTLHMVEGGFAIFGRRAVDGLNLPKLEDVPVDALVGSEGIFETSNSTLVLSSAGASGILTQHISTMDVSTESQALKPDANTNLASQRTLIPSTTHGVVGGLQEGAVITIVQSVFAVRSRGQAKSVINGERSLKERWDDRPNLGIVDGSEARGDFIVL